MKYRLSSLDILRGITIALMILGNFQPDESVAYTQLLHEPWEGVHIIDMAFPGFVFMMGAAMVFSKSSFRYGWQLKLLKRVVILFVLGIIYDHCGGIFAFIFMPEFDGNALYDMWITHARFMGVLQRLALSYGLGMLIYYFLRDSLKLWVAALVLMACSSAGYHVYNPSMPFDQLNNISTALDSIFPGAAHNYCGAPFDPEGLYGTVNSTATVLCGIIAGNFLKDRWNLERGIGQLFIAGAGLLLAGFAWSMVDIISKPLWTSPYVLLMAGADMIILSILTYFTYNFSITEKIFELFTAVGRNPLAIYVFSGVIIRLFLCIQLGESNLYDYFWLILKDFIPDAALAAFLYAGIWFLVFAFIGGILYKKKIIITV